MIGNDGEFGATQALDDKVSLNNVVMQVAGMASVISSDRIRVVANELPAFRGLLVKYELPYLEINGTPKIKTHGLWVRPKVTVKNRQ